MKWISPSISTGPSATAKLLIKVIEPYQPMFVEEPCQAQNHDINGRDRARHLPADRYRRARLHQVGFPRSARKEGSGGFTRALSKLDSFNSTLSFRTREAAISSFKRPRAA
jgi:hypothetical protein